MRSLDIKYMTKALPYSPGLEVEVMVFHTIVFPKSVATPTIRLSVINFYPKSLKSFSVKYFIGCRGLDFHRSNYILSKS